MWNGILLPLPIEDLFLFINMTEVFNTTNNYSIYSINDKIVNHSENIINNQIIIIKL